MFKYFIVLILGFTLMSCKGQKSGASTTTNVSNQATEKSTETLTSQIGRRTQENDGSQQGHRFDRCQNTGRNCQGQNQ